MSRQFEIAKQIIEETCPHRKLKLENIRLFASVIQCKKYHKGDIVLAEGEVCNNLLYIERGLLRHIFPVFDVILPQQSPFNIQQIAAHFTFG